MATAQHLTLTVHRTLLTETVSSFKIPHTPIIHEVRVAYKWAMLIDWMHIQFDLCICRGSVPGPPADTETHGWLKHCSSQVWSHFQATSGFQQGSSCIWEVLKGSKLQVPNPHINNLNLSCIFLSRIHLTWPTEPFSWFCCSVQNTRLSLFQTWHSSGFCICSNVQRTLMPAAFLLNMNWAAAWITARMAALTSPLPVLQASKPAP